MERATSRCPRSLFTSSILALGGGAFPLGTAGWHENMKSANLDYSNIREVTLTEWARFYLMHRQAPTHWQKCERLALEFYCDVWAQVESRNAQFHRMPSQQAKYRGARVAVSSAIMPLAKHAARKLLCITPSHVATSSNDIFYFGVVRLQCNLRL